MKSGCGFEIPVKQSYYSESECLSMQRQSGITGVSFCLKPKEKCVVQTVILLSLHSWLYMELQWALVLVVMLVDSRVLVFANLVLCAEKAIRCSTTR